MNAALEGPSNAPFSSYDRRPTSIGPGSIPTAYTWRRGLPFAVARDAGVRISLDVIGGGILGYGRRRRQSPPAILE